MQQATKTKLVLIATAAVAILYAGHTSALESSAPPASNTTLPAFAPPPIHATDKTLIRPFNVDMIAATDTQALLKMTGRMNRDAHYGVLDLATGCIVETYSTFARVEKLIHLSYVSGYESKPTTVEQRRAMAVQALADPTTQAEIRQYLAFRSRFGSRKDAEPIYSGDFAWSADGSKIVTVASETFFRSSDGGQSYEMMDTNMSRGPIMTRDGRYAFYQRCGNPNIHNYSCLKAQEVAIVDTSAPSGTKARVVNVGRGTIAGLDPTGQKLVFVRDDEPLKVVVTHLDPATAAFTRAFAIPAPPLKPQTYFTIDPSRDGRYGTFHHWVNDTQAKVAVVNMTDGRILFQQQRQFVGTDVDDDGRLAWGTVNSVRAFGTTPSGVVKDAGAGDRIGWAPGGRLLVFESPKGAAEQSPIGESACKIVKVVRVGS